MAELPAQPARASDTATEASKRLVAWAISNDVYAAWNTEGKILIGYALVFLQVLKF
jgi:hypothetical protein